MSSAVIQRIYSAGPREASTITIARFRPQEHDLDAIARDHRVVIREADKVEELDGRDGADSGRVVVSLAATAGSVDIGFRYILPFYPLFYIYAGKLIKLVRVVSFGRWMGGRFKTWIEPAQSRPFGGGNRSDRYDIDRSPHYIAYFNEFFGPVKGALSSSDSNIDWGQDLKRLEAYAEERKIGKIYVDYFDSYRTARYITIWASARFLGIL